MPKRFDHAALRKAREMRHRYQEEVAELAGCEDRYLRALENGEKSNPSFLLVYRLCEILDIPMTDLIQDEEELTSP